MKGKNYLKKTCTILLLLIAVTGIGPLGTPQLSFAAGSSVEVKLAMR